MLSFLELLSESSLSSSDSDSVELVSESELVSVSELSSAFDEPRFGLRLSGRSMVLLLFRVAGNILLVVKAWFSVALLGVSFDRFLLFPTSAGGSSLRFRWPIPASAVDIALLGRFRGFMLSSGMAKWIGFQASFG